MRWRRRRALRWRGAGSGCTPTKESSKGHPAYACGPTHSSKRKKRSRNSECLNRSTFRRRVRLSAGGANSRSGAGEIETASGQTHRHTRTQTFCDKVKEQSRATHNFTVRVEQPGINQTIKWQVTTVRVVTTQVSKWTFTEFVFFRLLINLVFANFYCLLVWLQ